MVRAKKKRLEEKGTSAGTGVESDAHAESASSAGGALDGAQGSVAPGDDTREKAAFKKELIVGLAAIFVGFYMVIIFVNTYTYHRFETPDAISLGSWLTFFTFQVNLLFALYCLVFGVTRFITYGSKLQQSRLIKAITHNNVQIAFVVWFGISFCVTTFYAMPFYRGRFTVVGDDEAFFYHNFSFLFAVFLYFLVRGSAKAKPKWIPVIMLYPLGYALLATLLGTNYRNGAKDINGQIVGWLDMFNPENYEGQVWPILLMIAIYIAIFSLLSFALIRLKAWLDTNYYLL